MSNDNPHYRPDNVRGVLETWIQGKQDAFAHALFKALEEHPDGLQKSTIVSALSRAKTGTNADAVKQLFGTPARREAFAQAAGRSLSELEAALGADPSDEPLVFFVAEDVAWHHSQEVDGSTSLALVVRDIAAAGCAPRIFTSEPWRKRLKLKDEVQLDEWRARGWVLDLPMPWDVYREGILRAFESATSRRKFWVRGRSLGGLPVLQSLAVYVDATGAVHWTPTDVLERLRSRGYVAEPPRPAPEASPEGTRLELVSLTELARRAGASLESEPFKPIEIQSRESLRKQSAESMAALIELARGHPLSDVGARRDHDPWNLPLALEPLKKLSGPPAEWGEAARLVLSLGHLLDEKTALPLQVVEQAVRLGGAHVDREQLLRESPRAAIVQPPMDAFLIACERHNVSLEGIADSRFGTYITPTILASGQASLDRGLEIFVEESIAGETRLRPLGLTVRPHWPGGAEQPAQVAARLAREGKRPTAKHPMEELAEAARAFSPRAEDGVRMRNNHWTVGPLESLPAGWDLAERAIAAIASPGVPVDDPHGPLLELLTRPLATLSAVYLNSEYLLPQVESLGRSFDRVRRLGPFVGSAFEAPAPDLVAPIVEELLRLKVALCHGQALELRMDGAAGLVLSGPGGYRGTVRVWRTRASCDRVHAALVIGSTLSNLHPDTRGQEAFGRFWIGGADLFAEIWTGLLPHQLLA